MNKIIMKILICTLILLMGIGVVNAMDHNTTDEAMNYNQDDVLSVSVNDSDVFTVEENNDVVEVCENDDEILSVENNANEVLSVCNDSGEFLSVGNDNDLISANNNDEKLGAKNNSNDSGVVSKPGEYYNIPNEHIRISSTSKPHLYKYSYSEKEVLYAKVKVTKKQFKKYMLNKPSKKNKKVWKKYKKFKKSFRKKFNKSYKKRVKAIKKKMYIEWGAGTRCEVYFGHKYVTFYFITFAVNGM